MAALGGLAWVRIHPEIDVRPSLSTLAATALATGSLVLLAASPAAAESRIKQPGAHPDYHFEAEPHFMFGVDPPGPTAGQGFGPGFRGTIELVDNGFIASINNSVGLGLGFDWIAFSKKSTSIWVPIVMQWNFWLSDHWSVFGEPGFGFYLGNATGIRPVGAGGVRLHFNDTIALTLRAGYPTLSLGLSFLL